MSDPRRVSRGFTMLEALVALVVGLVILNVAMKELVDAIKVHHSQSQIAEMRQNARNLTEFWSRDLVPAGYGMSAVTDFAPALIPNEPTNLTDFSSNILTFRYNALDVATRLTAVMSSTAADIAVSTSTGFAAAQRVLIWDNTAAFDWITLSGVPSSTTLQHTGSACTKAYDDADESAIAVITEISYKWDSSTREVLRQQDGGSWNTVAQNVQSLEFHYFAQDGTELFPNDAISRAAVRSIELKMTCRTKEIDRVTRAYKTFKVDTSISPRNLAYIALN